MNEPWVLLVIWTGMLLGAPMTIGAAISMRRRLLSDAVSRADKGRHWVTWLFFALGVGSIGAMIAVIFWKL
jgi:hypothetical protein